MESLKSERFSRFEVYWIQTDKLNLYIFDKRLCLPPAPGFKPIGFTGDRDDVPLSVCFLI